MHIAILIPARDEATSLQFLLPKISDEHRVIVIDNGSVDGTAAVALNHQCEVVYAPRAGYGTAIQAGLNHLRAQPPDIVVILDADASDSPELIGALVEPIVSGEADLVFSDRSTLADKGSLTAVQRWGNWFATTLIALSTGRKFHDLGPFRALRFSTALKLNLVDETWGWNVEMNMRAVQADLRIVELSMPYKARTHGHSKISGDLKGAIRAGTRILYAVYRYRER